MTKSQLVLKMVNFLTNSAAQKGVSFKGMNLVNYNSFLCRVFQDGGLVCRTFNNMSMAGVPIVTKDENIEGRMLDSIEAALEIVIERQFHEDKQRREKAI